MSPKKVGKLIKGIRKKKKPKERIYEISVEPETIEKYLPEAFRRAYYDLLGKYDKALKTIEELKSQIAEIRKEKLEEEKRIAYQQELLIKKLRRENILPFIFKTPKPITLVSALSNYSFFYDSKGKKWKYWRGILWENTRDGLCFRFIVGDGKELRVLPDYPIPIDYFPYLINKNTAFTDMSLGRLPIYLTKEGYMPPITLRGSESDIEEVKKKYPQLLEFDVRNILEKSDEDVQQAFFLLYHKYLSAMEELKRARELAKRHWLARINAEITSEAVMKSLESRISSLELYANKLEAISSRLETKTLSEMEARQTAGVMEALQTSLWRTINSIKKMIESQAIPIEERARRRLLSDLEFLLKNIPIEVVKPKEEKAK